jgi:hypothetical protein
MVFLLIVAFEGCSSRLPVFTKTQYIEEFESFSQYIDNNYLTFDEAERQKFDLKFKELKGQYNSFSKDMSESEQVEVDKMIGNYYSCVAKYRASQAQKDLKRLYHQAEGFMENISK